MFPPLRCTPRGASRCQQLPCSRGEEYADARAAWPSTYERCGCRYARAARPSLHEQRGEHLVCICALARGGGRREEGARAAAALLRHAFGAALVAGGARWTTEFGRPVTHPERGCLVASPFSRQARLGFQMMKLPIKNEPTSHRPAASPHLSVVFARGGAGRGGGGAPNPGGIAAV